MQNPWLLKHFLDLSIWGLVQILTASDWYICKCRWITIWRLRKWNIQQYCYGICGMTLVVVGKSRGLYIYRCKLQHFQQTHTRKLLYKVLVVTIHIVFLLFHWRRHSHCIRWVCFYYLYIVLFHFVGIYTYEQLGLLLLLVR